MFEVCLDARMLRDGGIGTSLKNIIPYLDASGAFRLHLLCRPQDESKFQELNSGRTIPFPEPIYSIREQMGFLKKIPPCDLFWSPHFNVPLFPVRAKQRLTTLQDVFHLAHFSSLTFLQKLYAALFYNLAAFRSAAVATISEFSRKEMMKHCWLKPSHIHVIPLGVSEIYTRVADVDRIQEIRKRYALPQAFILSVGNVKPHKNLLKLLYAYEASGIPHHWVIVGKKEGFLTGDGAFFTCLKESKCRARIHLLGEIPDQDMPVIYSLANLFVFPSLYEGFGLPPLEAMACGCPAVVSHRASLPEICENAVEYVNPYCVQSIAWGIRRVLTDPLHQERLVKKGIQLIKKYTWEKTAMEYVKVFLDLCSQR